MMKVEKNKLYSLLLLLLLPLCATSLYSQADSVRQIADTVTVDLFEVSDEMLKKVDGIQSAFDKSGNEYKKPKKLTARLQKLTMPPSKRDTIPFPPEIVYWLNYKPEPLPESVLRDTTFTNPLFLPLIFDAPIGFDPVEIEEYPGQYKFPWMKDKQLFGDPLLKEKIGIRIRREVKDYLKIHHPESFAYSSLQLPDNYYVPLQITKDKPQDILREEIPQRLSVFEDVDAPVKFIPDRKYWRSAFESTIQFSQNYVSPNWHKGGNSNLNVYVRNLVNYNYEKDKVKIENTLELKASAYDAPKDTIRDYRIADDVFRLRSNVGYKAFDKWYYTFDTEFKTQVFSNYIENTHTKAAALLSPMSIRFGLGMKYDLNKKFESDKYKKLVISANVAPISYTYMYSVTRKDIDLGRHGFQKEEDSGQYKHYTHLFGTSINANVSFDINRSVRWVSRLDYNTTYSKVIMEFENTFTFALSRFFSTTININTRFDDSVTKKEDFDSYLQINELLRFGFNYRW